MAIITMIRTLDRGHSFMRGINQNKDDENSCWTQMKMIVVDTKKQKKKVEECS